MALWGAEVKPGKEYVHKLSQAHGLLRITRATLGSQNILGWSNLEARVGHERRATLCTLHPISKPMCGLELEFDEENNVTFSVDGQTSIYLSGYYIYPKAAMPALYKREHQEMPDSGSSKKSRRVDVKEEALLKVDTIIEGRPGAKVATVGSKVGVSYVGCLKTGSVFDQGKRYQFRLGAGKVVPGWEIGIAGMKVGEERRITIPPFLGYGGLKQENIPANSWLIYTVTLLEVENTNRTNNGSKDA